MSAQSKKAVILDSVQAKKIITQLIQGDVAKAENKLLKQADSISQKRILTLKEASKQLEKAFLEKELEAISLRKDIDVKDKIIKRENAKKSFWKITGIVGISTTTFLLLLNK
jgi:hypothetical protein